VPERIRTSDLWIRSSRYRVLFHHFDRFLTEYEARFEREYGFSGFTPTSTFW